MRDWRCDEDGATAIEFALLFMPYLLLSLAIIELSLMYVSASMLESATTTASRQIRTGQIQGTADPQVAFRDSLCDGALFFISCNDVVVDVITLNSFNDFDTVAAQYDADGNMVSQGFNAGGSDDRVLVRTAARYDMMTPFIGTLLAGSDGAVQFMSTIVLQTEPYEFDPDA